MEKPYPPPQQGNVDMGPGINIATGVVCGIVFIIVGLRMAVRTWITKSLWWDDWTILFAAIGDIIGAAFVFVEVHYGFGRPQYYLGKWQLIEFKKYSYGEWTQTFATLMWTKVSICLFLMRIPVSVAHIRPLKLAVWALILSNVVLTILWLDQCRPVSAAWNEDVEGTCFSRGILQRVILAQAIISAVSDFVFATYPIFILWKVQMELRSKVAVCCLMGVGVFTGACCIVRTVLNYQSIPTDLTYGGVTNWFWRHFEVQIGIIAACVPALRPGYRWLTQSMSRVGSSERTTKLSDELRLQHAPTSSPSHRLKQEGVSSEEISRERGYATYNVV